MRHYRTLSRVDDFLNRLFLEVGALICTLALDRQEVVGQKLQLHAKDREGVRSPYFSGAQSTTEGRRAFLSHNACTEAVIFYSGILSYLVQTLNLPVDVSEVLLCEVQPNQEIVIIQDGEETRVATYHNLFVITATSTVTPLDNHDLTPLLEEEGLYIDITAGQYGRKPGLTSVKAYPAIAYFAPACIGERYYDHIFKIRNGDYKKEDLVSEAVVRTINNAFLRECDTIGGLTSFSNDDEVAYALGIKRLIKAVSENVWKLQSELDAIRKLNGEDIELVARYKDIARKCAGAGHSTVIAALAQASHQPLGKFECL